jgi:hypothetical protein
MPTVTHRLSSSTEQQGFGRVTARVIKAGKSKEAILGRSGIIWTVVGVLLIIALLIYIF